MNRRTIFLPVLLACVACPAWTAAQDRQALMDLLSGDSGWTISTEPAHYAPDEIEAVVADDAGIVRSYGIRGISRFGAERAGPADRVEVTLFEMLDSTAAFGLFGLERNWRAADFTPATVGVESYRQGGRLVVWQSNYVAVMEGAASDTEDLGTLLANSIVGSSRKPPVSTFLPRAGLIRDSERYILTPESFAEVTGIDPAPLGFENSAEAAVAEYESEDGGTGRLAMLLYPTQHLASLHLDTWIEQSETDPPNRRTGPLLGIVIDSNDDQLTAQVLDGLSYRSEVTWNQPPPDPLTLPVLILTVFSWIGIALGFTLIVGLGYGGIRIYMKTRYPDRFLGASPNAEFIQLKIGQPVTKKEWTP